MNGGAHKIIGVSTLIALTAACVPSLVISGMTIYPSVGIPAAYTGAVLADIDLTTSAMGRKHPHITKLFTHRGFTHTGIVVLGLALVVKSMAKLQGNPFTSIAQSLVFGLVISYGSHIFADMFNGKGVPLLWPICRRKISIFDISLKHEMAFVGMYILLLMIHIYCCYTGLSF